MPITNNIIFRSKKFFSILIAVIFIAGLTLTYYVYNFAKDSHLESLVQSAQIMAISLQAEEIKQLQGSETDLTNPAYLKLKEKLQKVITIQPDVKFVYLTGYRDNLFFFYVDSEDPNSEDYSPPGQTYPEADHSFFDAYQTGNANVTGPTADRWGNWISALAPIFDPATGQVLALVGMDIDASYHQSYVLTNTSIPALITLFLLILAFVGQRISRHEQQITELKSEFVSIASHELRSPLNGITWALDNIVKAPNLTPDQTSRIAEIKSTTGNLMNNVNDILNASTITDNSKSQLRLEPVDLNHILESVIEQQSLTAQERKIEIGIHNLPPGSHHIKADKEKLKRAFNNILSNSIKYSPDNSAIRISFQQTAENYIIQFSDHGIGIPATDLPKIFDGYYRAKNAVDSGITGTGLGLYFAKKIVERHGGKLWIKSTQDQGTTVFIKLPTK